MFISVATQPPRRTFPILPAVVMQAYPNEPNADMRERSAREQAGTEKKWHVVRRLKADHSSPDVEMAFEALIGDRIVAVFRHQSHWYAIDAMCSHQGGPLAEGIVRDGCVTCPWHGWQYELATGVQTINRQPLQETFQVRCVHDTVEVFL